jgi:hypothetical protein
MLSLALIGLIPQGWDRHLLRYPDGYRPRSECIHDRHNALGKPTQTLMDILEVPQRQRTDSLHGS